MKIAFDSKVTKVAGTYTAEVSVDVGGEELHKEMTGFLTEGEAILAAGTMMLEAREIVGSVVKKETENDSSSGYLN